MRLMVIRPVLALLALMGLGSRAHADIGYVLNPGSTFTPDYPNAPTFSPIPLTGTFVWRVDPLQGGLQPFKVIQMNLTAGPYTFTADSTPVNDEDSDTFSTGGSYFNEILDATNLPISPVWASEFFQEGTFTGNFQSPTTISYTQVAIAHLPAVGGSFVGFMTFSATQIPEPCSLALLSMPLAMLMRRRRNG